MTEKDLDIVIEMCERIMEFDTRTMQNPVSENGWIFEKVYELLKYLRQFQFATDTNVGGTSDTISRQAVIDAVESVDWYHQNKNSEMVHGANDNEHQAWYKAEDIYKAIENVPSAQLAQDLPKGCTDTISRQAAIDALEKVADMFPWRVPGNRDTYDRYNEAWNDAIGRAEMEIENMPTAQPGWIPCSERLPKVRQDVVMQFEQNIAVGFFSHGNWNVNTGNGLYTCIVESDDQPISWMPLPGQYHPKGDDKHEG